MFTKSLSLTVTELIIQHWYNNYHFRSALSRSAAWKQAARQTQKKRDFFIFSKGLHLGFVVVRP